MQLNAEEAEAFMFCTSIYSSIVYRDFGVILDCVFM